MPICSSTGFLLGNSRNSQDREKRPLQAEFPTRGPERARPYFTRAWSLLPDTSTVAEGLAHPLSYPAQLLYRPPAAARRFRDQPLALVTESAAVAEFTVTADGRVTDVQIVENDAGESQAASFKTAIGKAIYRPRLVDGVPVATEKTRYRESFRQMKR